MVGPQGPAGVSAVVQQCYSQTLLYVFLLLGGLLSTSSLSVGPMLPAQADEKFSESE